MKKLLYFMLLAVFLSCQREIESEIKPDTINSSVKDSINLDSLLNIPLSGPPIKDRSFYMSNNISVDTLYLEKGHYKIDFDCILIYKNAQEICYADLDNLKDVTFKHDGKVLGYAKFKYYQLNTIEMYNWFTISEIQIDGEPAYEIRSTGNNPDSLSITFLFNDYYFKNYLCYFSIK